MKKIFKLLLISLMTVFFSMPLTFAQPADDFLPAASNVRGAQYPKISSDNSVSLLLKAPDAMKVQVQGGDGLCPKPVDLVKDTDGNWTLVIPNAGPGFHYYWFMVDGVRVNDPGSEAYFGYGLPTSGIEVPVTGEDFFLAKMVSHGDVREHWYYSGITGAWRRAFVYTPPDYDKDYSKQYPVLYLLHGAGENERGWSLQGHMSFIMDNLIAAGKAVPMVVVMDCGYATAKDGSDNTGQQRDFTKMAVTLEKVYVQEIMPSVESFYRIRVGRENRAMAGLSMGGFQTLMIGLSHTELFSHYGLFSAAIFGDILKDPKTALNGTFADAASFNSKVKVLWFGAGTGEEQFITMMKDSRKKLDELGIKSIAFESQGTFHEWHTWRRCLNEFAPLLFH